jgi:uncharacterized protein
VGVEVRQMSNFDIAFSPSVKQVQEQRGARKTYARREAQHDLGNRVTPDIAAFLASANTAYLATVNADGQPYIQHRGGPDGFLRVLDERTIGFADFSGNRQFITTGNLIDNPKAFLFVMDYINRQRLKFWGVARTTRDPDEIAPLVDPEYRAKIEQAILFRVTAWDANCPQHIPQMFPAESVGRVVHDLQDRIAALEAEVKALRGSDQRS